MDSDVHHTPPEQQFLVVAGANTSSAPSTDYVSAVSVEISTAAAVLGGNAAALRAGNPWLWAPHVAIGALLLLLMAASFLRFHCKYGHKYRTGSQSFSSTLRLAPKNAWTLDKKTSSTSLPRSKSTGHGVTISQTMANVHGRRAARTTAVIVLKPVGGSSGDGGMDYQMSSSLPRRSVDSVGGSTTTVDEVGQPPHPVRSSMYTASGGSTVSVDPGGGRMAESTTTVDLMSTSRGSEEDWAAVVEYRALHAGSAASADPWAEITDRRRNTTNAQAPPPPTTLRVSGQSTGQLNEIAHSSGTQRTATTSLSMAAAATGWWSGAGTSGPAVTSPRISEVYPSHDCSVLRHHHHHHETAALQGPGEAGVLVDDTQRLIDDANDQSVS